MVRPKHKQYETAEDMFVEQGMTCNAISEMLGMTEATLSKWRNTMSWDDARKLALSRPDKIKGILLAELQSISEGNKPKIDTDALSKVSKTLSYFDDKVALSVVVAVLKEFDNYMVEIEPAMAVKFTEYHRMFIHQRASFDSLK